MLGAYLMPLHSEAVSRVFLVMEGCPTSLNPEVDNTNAKRFEYKSNIKHHTSHHALALTIMNLETYEHETIVDISDIKNCLHGMKYW